MAAELSAADPRETEDLMPKEREASVVLKRFSLTVQSGIDAGFAVRSQGDSLVVGTHESASFVLRDPAVSRFHCELSLVGERLVLRDLGSKNGTRLDGVAIDVAYPRPDSVITLGASELRIRDDGDVARVPVSARERFGVLVGRSVAMRRAFAVLERAARAHTTVLLTGETGTGE